MKDIFIKTYLEEDEILFYIKFKNGEPFRQIEISSQGIKRLSLDNPVEEDSMLTDQPLAFAELENCERITSAEFENIMECTIMMRAILKLAFILSVITFSCKAEAQDKLNFSNNYVKTSPFNVSSLSKKITLEGKPISCLQWEDSLGRNVLILSETGRMTSANAENSNAALYAYHYLFHKDSIILIWKLVDFVKECPVDVVCEFYKNSCTITDLDKNGIAEITFLYALSCKGGVDPDTKKLMMYEGKNKFAMRGTSIVIENGKENGGEKAIDKSFLSAPIVFREFANKQWDKFGIAKY